MTTKTNPTPDKATRPCLPPTMSNLFQMLGLSNDGAEIWVSAADKFLLKREAAKLVNEHAALESVAEAAKKSLNVLGDEARINAEHKLQVALANLAAIRKEGVK